MEEAQGLEGGNLNADVSRVGDMVHRDAGPWTPAVHSLLHHLDRRSFPAPKPHGFGAGRETLSYIPGEPVHPNNLHLIDTPEAMFRVGELIASYHDAQTDYEAPAEASWRDEGRDPTGSLEVLAHNDLSPWNLIVGPQGWTFIDWDLAAPGRRMWDLAWALHSFAGLWPDAPRSDQETVARIAAFCEGARVAVDDRTELLETVVERTGQHAAFLRERAEAGETVYRRLVADGHADSWESGSVHVRSNMDIWLDILNA